MGVGANIFGMHNFNPFQLNYLRQLYFRMQANPNIPFIDNYRNPFFFKINSEI